MTNDGVKKIKVAAADDGIKITIQHPETSNPSSRTQAGLEVVAPAAAAAAGAAAVAWVDEGVLGI